MRTNIEIDDKLLKEAMKVAGVKTKKAAVEEALQRMVRIRRQSRIADLVGKVEFYDGVIQDRIANDIGRRSSSKRAA